MLTPLNIIDIFFQKTKKFNILNDSVFHYLRETIVVFHLRKALQELHIDEYSPWLVKCSQEIFPLMQVNGRFSPYATVHLGHERSGDIDIWNRSHKG
jgi:hypothetical protein